MSIWKKLFGAEPPPDIAMPEATARERSQAEFHRDRFARAITQCRAAVARGEKPDARLAELQRWYDYYAGLASAEAALAAASEGGAV